VAVAGGGEFSVAWVSPGSAGTDTSGTSVQARRFASDGSALRGEFQVNTFTTGAQMRPHAAASAAGDQFQVNTYTTGLQARPR